MAINVNENGTIKEIGTKINGFTIDEVDLLLDDYVLNKGATKMIYEADKYRFLLVQGTLLDTGTNNKRLTTYLIDLKTIRRLGASDATIQLLMSQAGNDYLYVTYYNSTDTKRVAFKYYTTTSVIYLTVFGIACSTTE